MRSVKARSEVAHASGPHPTRAVASGGRILSANRRKKSDARIDRADRLHVRVALARLRLINYSPRPTVATPSARIQPPWAPASPPAYPAARGTSPASHCPWRLPHCVRSRCSAHAGWGYRGTSRGTRLRTARPTSPAAGRNARGRRPVRRWWARRHPEHRTLMTSCIVDVRAA